MITVSAAARHAIRSIQSRMIDRPIPLPRAVRIHVDHCWQENVGGRADNHLFHSATQAGHSHPQALRYKNAPGSLASANVLGLREADNLFDTDVTFFSRRQRQKHRPPHESDWEPSAAIEAMTNQKKGVLYKRDFKKSSDYQNSHDSTFQPKRRPRLPHYLAGQESAEFRKAQYGRLGVSRGPDYPLLTETECVSATRKTHITAQTSWSRGEDYPTFTRIEAGSFSQKARIRRAVHPFSAEKSHSSADAARPH